MSKYVSQNPRPIYYKRAKFVIAISPRQKIVNKLSRTHFFLLCLQGNGLRSSQDMTFIQNSREMHRKTNDIDSPEDSYTFKNGISQVARGECVLCSDCCV